MMPWSDFEDLFLTKTKDQAQGMLVCLALGVRMALTALPRKEENEMARAYLYLGMAMALRSKLMGFETLNDFLDPNYPDFGQLTPERQQELQTLWEQFKERCGVQDVSPGTPGQKA